DRAVEPAFSDDARFVAFTIRPAKEALEEAERKKTPRAKMPADTLGILDLSTGAVTRVPRVRGFRMPARAGGWIAYQLAREPDADTAADSAGAGRAQGAGEPADSSAAPEHEREDGHPLVLRNLTTGEERRIEDVVSYLFAEDGARLVYSRSTEEGDADGVYVLQTANGATTTLRAGKGQYRQLAVDEAGRQVAFLANDEEFAEEQPSWRLYTWDGRAASAREAAAPG